MRQLCSFNQISWAARTELAPWEQFSELCEWFRGNISCGWVCSLGRSPRFLEIHLRDRWMSRAQGPRFAHHGTRLRTSCHRSERKSHSHETIPAWTRPRICGWKNRINWITSHWVLLWAVGEVHDSETTAYAIHEWAVLNTKRMITTESLRCDSSHHIEFHRARVSVPCRAFVLSDSTLRCNASHHRIDNRQSLLRPFALQAKRKSVRKIYHLTPNTHKPCIFLGRTLKLENM